MDLVNGTNVAHTVAVWLMLTGPGPDRILERVFTDVHPGGSFHRGFRQRIAGGVQAGMYSVIGNAGAFPAARVSDRFRFEKR